MTNYMQPKSCKNVGMSYVSQAQARNEMQWRSQTNHNAFAYETYYTKV